MYVVLTFTKIRRVNQRLLGTSSQQKDFIFVLTRTITDIFNLSMFRFFILFDGPRALARIQEPSKNELSAWLFACVSVFHRLDEKTK